MRWAILSDIHGNLPALEAVLRAIAAEGIEHIAQLGDALSGPLWPAETAERLMALDWPAIAGNHERQVLTLPPDRMGPTDRHAAERLDEAQRAWMQGLPATRWLDEDIFCCHGTPASDLVYLMETVTPDFGLHGSLGIRAASAAELAERLGGTRARMARMVLCGHSHVPRVAQAGDRLVVNPGSVGLPAYDDDHPHRHHVENGSPLARWAVVERGPSGYGVALRATPYDHEQAARQAEANGRGDWADALRTGRVGRTEADVKSAPGGVQ
jgi:predicted phosphodiesterase